MTVRHRETPNRIVVFWDSIDTRDDLAVREFGKAVEGFCRTAATSGKKVIVDLSGTPFITSTVLGEFIQLNRFAKQHDVPFGLANLGPQILEVFKVTRLDSVLHIDDDSDEQGGLGGSGTTASL